MTWEKEGRRAPRLATDLQGTLHVRTAREVRIVDLSRTGCLARCTVPLDVGIIVDIDAELEGEPFVAKARVAEVSLDGTAGEGDAGCLVGLEFLGLSAQEESRLRAYLEREQRHQ